MTSISNSPTALLPIHFTNQKLIRSKHRKGAPGIMVELMLGVLSDALLVLYQTEVFKTEKTNENICQLQLAIIFRQGSSSPSFTAFSEQIPP